MSGPPRPREGLVFHSVAPPPPRDNDTTDAAAAAVPEDQLQEWLACTVGWRALELSWGALQSCGVRRQQLKPLLQAALQEAARLSAPRLVVRQLDVDEQVGRYGVALGLAAFPNLTRLELRDLNLYDEAMGHVCDALHAAEHVSALLLDGVWASAAGWQALAAAIKVNTSLRKLRLRRCLSGPVLGPLCAALAGYGGAVEDLRLSDNGLGAEGVADVCRAVAQTPSLRSAGSTSRAAAAAGASGPPLSRLDLSHNAAGPACVPAAVALLRGHAALRSLDLSYNDLGPEGVRELCRAVAAAPGLRRLALAATGADDTAAEALARALTPTLPVPAASSSPSLEALDLSHNRLGARGAAALAAAACRPSCGLADVDLGGNAQVGEAGAKAWADVLTSPAGGSRLRRLVLSGCEVPDEGAYSLGAALKANTCLTELGLADNHITANGVALLAQVLRVNATLRLLDVSHNMVGPQGVSPFTATSHLRGHVVLSKPDHAVHTVPVCCVRAEVLPEYRRVEAVKTSDEPWEREKLLTNPFLVPPPGVSLDTLATAGRGGGGGGGAWGAGAAAGQPRNPFLSPAQSGDGAFGANPFATGGGRAPSNPFLSPQGSAPNPFAEGAGGGGAGAGGAVPNPFMPTVHEGGALGGDLAGRTQATRVLERRASQDSSLASSGGGDGGGGSMTLSSRSTADEGDLVTELDLRLVDYLLEQLDMGAGDIGGGGGGGPQEVPAGAAAASAPAPTGGQQHAAAKPAAAWAPAAEPPPAAPSQPQAQAPAEQRHGGLGGVGEPAWDHDSGPASSAGAKAAMPAAAAASPSPWATPNFTYAQPQPVPEAASPSSSGSSAVAGLKDWLTATPSGQRRSTGGGSGAAAPHAGEEDNPFAANTAGDRSTGAGRPSQSLPGNKRSSDGSFGGASFGQVQDSEGGRSAGGAWGAGGAPGGWGVGGDGGGGNGALGSDVAESAVHNPFLAGQKPPTQHAPIADNPFL